MTTGIHFQNFHHLLMRIPIRKTTKSPSSWAVIREGIIRISVSQSLIPHA